MSHKITFLHNIIPATVVAMSLNSDSNWDCLSLSDTWSSPLVRISLHTSVWSSFPKILMRSSFLATWPFDTFVNTVCVWSTSSISVSLKILKINLHDILATWSDGWRVDRQFHLFLTWIRDGRDQWLPWTLCGTHYVRGWVRSRASLNVLKIKCPCSDFSPILTRSLGLHGLFVCFTNCSQLLWVPSCLCCKVKFLVRVHRAAKD